MNSYTCDVYSFCYFPVWERLFDSIKKISRLSVKSFRNIFVAFPIVTGGNIERLNIGKMGTTVSVINQYWFPLQSSRKRPWKLTIFDDYFRDAVKCPKHSDDFRAISSHFLVVFFFVTRGYGRLVCLASHKNALKFDTMFTASNSYGTGNLLETRCISCTAF